MTPTIYELQGIAVTPDVWSDVEQAAPDLRFARADLVTMAERGDGTLARLLSDLQAHVPAGQLVLMGSSLGAHVALELAAVLGDRVVGTLLLAPGPAVMDDEFLTRARGMLRVLEHWTDDVARSLVPLLLYRFGPRYRANEERLLRMLSIAAQRSVTLLGVCAAFKNAPELLAQVKGPVHVLIGADNGNPVTGPMVYDSWRRVLGDEIVERISSAAEYIQMDRPELVAERLRSLAGSAAP